MIPPILAAHLDLEDAADAFHRTIADAYTAAKRTYDAAKVVYLEAGGAPLADDHPAVIAYTAAEHELVRWAQIETECRRIEVPKLRDLGLGATGSLQSQTAVAGEERVS